MAMKPARAAVDSEQTVIAKRLHVEAGFAAGTATSRVAVIVGSRRPAGQHRGGALGAKIRT